MSLYKTQAIRRIEAYFEVNYNRLQELALKMIKGDNVEWIKSELVWDLINDTYVQLIAREETGKNSYRESYGVSFDAYVIGALSGNIKAMYKAPKEYDDSSFVFKGDDEKTEVGYLERVGVSPDLDKILSYMQGTEEVCHDIVSICDKCNTNVAYIISAIENKDTLNSNFLQRFFLTISKASKKDASVRDTLKDFIKLYQNDPNEVTSCLTTMGIQIH